MDENGGGCLLLGREKRDTFGLFVAEGGGKQLRGCSASL